MKTSDVIKKYIKLAPSDVCYFRFILESYEGMLAATSIVPKETVMSIMISPDFLEDAEKLLENLKKEVDFEEISDLSPYKERIRNET